jgi:hypothetical protein
MTRSNIFMGGVILSIAESATANGLERDPLEIAIYDAIQKIRRIEGLSELTEDQCREIATAIKNLGLIFYQEGKNHGILERIVHESQQQKQLGLERPTVMHDSLI